MTHDLSRDITLKSDASFLEKEVMLNGISLYSWSLSPGEPDGTVLFFHGFLDHSFTNAYIIDWLLNEKNMRVVAGDMPGHGRSGGVRGGIDSFDTYTAYCHEIIEAWGLVASEVIGIGHSTGASILINYSRQSSIPFMGLVFAAPLIKINYHNLIDKGIDFAHPKIMEIPARRMKSCRNRVFLKTKWNDPMGVKKFSISWVRALVEWNRHWIDFTSEIPLLVLQGKKDTTVEWKNNIPILERCYINSEIMLYKRMGHHILNEKEGFRKIVFHGIGAFIESVLT